MKDITTVNLAMSAGHSCWPPTICATGKPRVTVNGRMVATIGDTFVPHGGPGCPTHTPVVADGTPLMSIDGLLVSRVTSPLSCGDTVATGDPLVTFEL